MFAFLVDSNITKNTFIFCQWQSWVEEYWMKIENPEIFKDYLGVSIKNSKGIIKQEAMDYFKKMVSGKIPFSNVIWRMIIFGLCMEFYQVNLDLVDK